MKSKFPDCEVPEIKEPEDVFDTMINIFYNRFGKQEPVVRSWLTDSEIFETIREAKEKYIEGKEGKRIESEDNHDDRPDDADSDRDPGGAGDRGRRVSDATSQK